MVLRWSVVAVVVMTACGSKDGDKKDVQTPLYMNKIASAAKEAANLKGKFPSGNAGPTPAQPCCSQPDKKCKVTAVAWSEDKVWRELNFTIDEPFTHQYSYEGDGKTFTAKAIGCDGAKSMTLTGTIDPSGMPKIEMRE